MLGAFFASGFLATVLQSVAVSWDGIFQTLGQEDSEVVVICSQEPAVLIGDSNLFSSVQQ